MEKSRDLIRTDSAPFLKELIIECGVQVIEPQGGDTYIRACNVALLDALSIPGHHKPDQKGTTTQDSEATSAGETLRDILGNAFIHRGAGLSPTHANRLIVRALQRQALAHPLDYYYPGQFNEPSQWQKLLADVLANERTREEFSGDLLTRNIQTNIAGRGASLKLLALLAQERWDDHGLRILEIGCGQNQVLKKLALNSRHGRTLGFGYQEIGADPVRNVASENVGLLGPRDINMLLKVSAVAVRSALGIDKVPLAKSGDELDWVRSQFYPSEYLDSERIEEAELLDQVEVANVGFALYDVTEADSSNFEKVLAQGPFDIVLFGTMLYQLDSAGRAAAEQFARQVVNPDRGIIVYQDFIDVDPDNPTKLRLREWTPYQYRTIIEDMRDPERRKQVLFEWDGGRCTAIRMGRAVLYEASGVVSALELLFRSFSSLKSAS